MSNVTNNRLNIIMTPAQMTAVKAAIATIQTNMPFLIGLTTKERMTVPKINVSNKAFTEDAINAAVNNPSIFPSYMNVSNMQTDLTLFTQLDEFSVLIDQLNQKIQDTKMLAGSEAYVSALTTYKIVGTASESGFPGMRTLYSHLKARFAGQGSTEKTDETD